MKNSYGAEFVDFDDDGDLDLFMVGADRQPTKIFRNNGGNMFTDVDTLTGHPLLSDVGGDLNGGRAVDYDNDGDLDLFFHDHLRPDSSDQARKLYRNDGNWQFTDVTAAEGIAVGQRRRLRQRLGRHRPRRRSGPDRPVHGTSARSRTRLPQRRLDQRQPLALRPARRPDRQHHRHRRRRSTPRSTTARRSERTLRREANTNAGTFNQSDLPVHFGLGAADARSTSSASAGPTGRSSTCYDVAVDQYLTIQFTPGDYNGDGTVDPADYTVWRNQLGQSVALPNESVTLGSVTPEDYAVWKANFGTVSVSLGAAGSGSLSNATVPEPPSWLLLVCLAAATLFGRRADVRNAIRVTCLRPPRPLGDDWGEGPTEKGCHEGSRANRRSITVCRRARTHLLW